MNNLGLLLSWQCVLDLGQGGTVGSPGLDNHSQAKLPADSPDVLADT